MKTIVVQHYGFNGDEYVVKFMTNNKKCHNGVFLIIDPQGNEHEFGTWERMKEYDFKLNRTKNNYIYCSFNFKDLENGLKKGNYYVLQDALKKQVYKFIKENE